MKRFCSYETCADSRKKTRDEKNWFGNVWRKVFKKPTVYPKYALNHRRDTDYETDRRKVNKKVRWEVIFSTVKYSKEWRNKTHKRLGYRA